MAQTTVTLSQIVPKGPKVVAHLAGDGTYGSSQAGSQSGLQIVDRPLKKAATQWYDGPIWQLTLPLILQAAPGPVDPACKVIEGWYENKPGATDLPVIKVTGPVPGTGKRWQVQDLSFAEAIRNSAGERTQQNLSLTLWEYSPIQPTTLSAASPAARAARTLTSSGNVSKRKYTVKQGDTLSSIAAHELGSANDWTEIASLNNIRDPRSISGRPSPCAAELMTVNAIKGFQPTGFPGAVVINGVPLGSLVAPFTKNATARAKDRLDVGYAVTQATLNRTTTGASTAALTFADPQRKLLRAGVFNYQDVLSYDGLNFTLVVFSKSTDTYTVTFEASGVADLRKQTGVKVYQANGTDLSGFAAQLVHAVPGLSLVACPDPINTGATAIGRGMSDDKDEDSWTCLNRLCTTVGWRVFECEGTIYLGPDTWLIGLTSEPYPVVEEFSEAVDNIDFDWDIGQPLGQMTLTANLAKGWGAKPGSAIVPKKMGALVGQKPQLVTSCQRDAYKPQATITCQIPMTAAQVISPTATGIENL